MKKRRGFSLLEILLALAIFGGALAVLSQIVGTGVDAGSSARELAMARLLCQSKLSELLLVNVTPTAVPSTPLPSPDSASDTIFEYAVEVAPAPIDGLLVLRVSVEAKSADSNASENAVAVASYSITRWIIDPLLGLEQAEAEAAAMRSSDPALGGMLP